MPTLELIIYLQQENTLKSHCKSHFPYFLTSTLQKAIFKKGKFICFVFFLVLSTYLFLEKKHILSSNDLGMSSIFMQQIKNTVSND